ncbi:hypothetical protein F0562_004886 [Nyssa sinensis]|uniref:Uncharacterized protein n=1 Tax=Nyssa sinensis TaxID=561372 RepID=A0A5J5AL30_9ASTE|nr:hypothetical protein F0562_004886 [Nyssa sinensis]
MNRFEFHLIKHQRRSNRWASSTPFVCPVSETHRSCLSRFADFEVHSWVSRAFTLRLSRVLEGPDFMQPAFNLGLELQYNTSTVAFF